MVQWPGDVYDGQRATYGLSPAAFLRATMQELVLCAGAREYRFTRDQVWKASRGDFYPWLFNSIKVHHAVSEHPNDIQFKPGNAGVHEVLASLSALGYPVT